MLHGLETSDSMSDAPKHKALILSLLENERSLMVDNLARCKLSHDKTERWSDRYAKRLETVETAINWLQTVKEI